MERQSYFGIPAYQNTAMDTNLYHSGGGMMSIPRPQSRHSHTNSNPQGQNHLSPHMSPRMADNRMMNLNESSTDAVDMRAYEEYQLAKRQANLRPHDTFQRDLARTLDQYQRGTEPSYKGHI